MSIRVQSQVLAAAVIAVMPVVVVADPALPTIPSGTFTVAAATGNATTDTANLKAALTSAKNAGGGTVIVPAGTYLSNALTLTSSINLQLSAGAVIQNNAPSSTLLTVSSSSHDVAITGSGMIDGHATATSSNNLVNLQGVTRLLISGVTIANSSHEHLVIEKDTDVTVNGITINDNYSIAHTGGYLSNTDAIDFSGTRFLIENTNINAGDDDIVAKPGSTYTSNITIVNNTIGAGHGISIGGQTNANLDGMTVSNITFNGTDNGLRLKAGTGQGGVVRNVSFSNITMTNVATPIIINSWYQSGDRYGAAQLSGSQLHNVTNPGETPVAVNQPNNTNLDPFYDNVSYSNITATGASQCAAIIYGLDSIAASANDPPRNIDTVSFSNVNLSGKYGANIYYASNLDLSGLTVTATGGNAFNLYGDTPLGDANGDGTVDLTDLSIVLNNFGATTSARSRGNFDGAATINLTDLSAVLNHFGTAYVNGGLAPGAPTAAGAMSAISVPEPASLAALLPPIFLFARRRRAEVSR
ncbi:MAG TPA: glycosyl hydrolase family 28 protein [Phycisphaerae bacterium]|nr:glycosyl hydrolase family 28 protein [Phycisphaerae bacterium]